MKNYRAVIQYEGTKYQGWQKQESTDNTIQGKLESILSKMCQMPVDVQGAGRTDAGVHAYGQIANFHLKTEKNKSEIMEYINHYLPEDVAVISLETVSDRFHSRLNAKGKTYRYRVLNTEIPHIFERRYVYELPDRLDLDAMRKAADLLCGTHDFKSFTSAKRGKKSTVRTVEAIEIIRAEDEIQFTFRGDGFLYHMIRIMMGTLLEVGLGKRSPESMPVIFAAANREKAGFLAPAKGLTLMEVRYS